MFDAIKNRNHQALTPSHRLMEDAELNFPLDEYSAPKPFYFQFDSVVYGRETLSVLNKYNHRLYIYDFSDRELVDTLNLQELSLNREISSFFMKSPDSVYFFDERNYQLLLWSGERIVKKIDLLQDYTTGNSDWVLKFPHYFPNSSAPLLFCKDRLYFVGLYPWAGPDALLREFNIIAQTDSNLESINYFGNYPSSVYNSHFDWDDPIYNTPYYDIDIQNHRLLLSFPVSHDLYFAGLSDMSIDSMYAGSNFATDIYSIGKAEAGDELFRQKMTQNINEIDLYGAIKYDQYRSVYYRFIRRSLKSKNKAASWRDKTIGILIYDKNFTYMGDTDIGTAENWNWVNSFVTRDGLFVEYLDNITRDETKLTFKSFRLEKY